MTRFPTTAALAVGSLVLFLALLEGLATLLGVAPLSEDPGHRAWVRQRTCMFRFGDAERACDAARLVAPRQPAAGENATPARRLVLAFGGSSTAGYAIQPHEAFPQRLGVLLERSFPGEYAVVNLGRPCKDSIYVRRCVETALAAEPELLIVYSGHNDYGNWLDSPRLRIALEEHGWVYDIGRRLTHSRAYSLAASWLRPTRSGPENWQPKASDENELAAASGIVLDAFTRNLTDVIERAGAAGSRVILVTVVSNLHEYPYRLEQWDPFLHDSHLQSMNPWAEHYAAGIHAFRDGRFDDSLAAFTRARDAWPAGRARSELNPRVRELAQAYPHVTLVDFEAEVVRAARADGIGCNLFGDESYCDQFHPNARAHLWLARLLAQRIEEERRGAE